MATFGELDALVDEADKELVAYINELGLDTEKYAKFARLYDTFDKLYQLQRFLKCSHT